MHKSTRLIAYAVFTLTAQTTAAAGGEGNLCWEIWFGRLYMPSSPTDPVRFLEKTTRIPLTYQEDDPYNGWGFLFYCTPGKADSECDMVLRISGPKRGAEGMVENATLLNRYHHVKDGGVTEIFFFNRGDLPGEYVLSVVKDRAKECRLPFTVYEP